jgi:hypothetical protein
MGGSGDVDTMTRSWILALALLASCGRDALSPAQREEVRAMIAADRVEQAQKVESERQQMLAKQVSVEVDRVAEENHLTAEQKKELLEVVRLNEKKVRDVADKLVDATRNADTHAFEGVYRDIGDWRLAELSARFGEGTGRRLNKDPFWLATWAQSLPPPH